MEECIFGYAKMDMENIEEGEWTERQYDQLKNLNEELKTHRIN